MNCNYCGEPVQSYAWLMNHFPTVHPTVNVRKPNKDERKAVIVGITEDKLAQFIL